MTIVPGSPEELAAMSGDANSKSAGSRYAEIRPRTAWAARLRRPMSRSPLAALNQVLQYEPRDLTISVGAGISYCELSRVLAEHRQMIPLDPPFSDRASHDGRHRGGQYQRSAPPAVR